jgi:aquacobalamin reductase/NAD(P)H-flavin reductase
MTTTTHTTNTTNTVVCDINTISPLTPSVYKIELVPQQAISFQAGQYVLIHMGEEDKRPFSIASATYEKNIIELHIGAEPANKYAFEVLERLQNNVTIEISGGFGEAFYREDKHKPSILIAGGTGFSYTYSILKEALQQDPNADVTLYWGGRKNEDLYLTDELTKLADKHPHFSYIPVVEFPETDWHGRTGWVHKAVMADYPSLSGHQVYIAGRFEMAKTARDDFFTKDLSKDALYGDAYAFI